MARYSPIPQAYLELGMPRSVLAAGTMKELADPGYLGNPDFE